MKKILAAVACTVILAGCGNGGNGADAEEQAAAARALQEQNEAVAQSMQDRWEARGELAKGERKESEKTPGGE